jgi:hypothetical protein
VQVGEAEAEKSNNGCYVCFVADMRPDWDASDAVSTSSSERREPRVAQRPLLDGPSTSAQLQTAVSIPRSFMHALDFGAIALALARSMARPLRFVQARALEVLLGLMDWQDALTCWGVSHQQRGIVGAVVFDTFGFHIPAERMANGQWRRRTNVGYISNMAVAPGSRRRASALC